MKTSPQTLFLLCSLSLGCFLGCKKVDPVTPGTQKPSSSNVNPKIAATVCDYDFNDTTLTANGWTKVFDDEFTGDLSNWYAYTGPVRNELQYYKPDNAQIANGVLQLSVKQESVTSPSAEDSTVQKTYNFTSGSIVSNSTFTANSATPKVRIIARVKVASGYGLVSLFESYGVDWPTNGQINFFQVEGNDTKEYFTNYFYGQRAGENLVKNGFFSNPADEDLSTCWHVFETEWTKSSLNYYLDGKLVETKTADDLVPFLFGKAENIALSVPIGGLYYENLVPANVQTGVMYIDYVKVFTSH
ncbi:MAG: glycoside hydrolase family 16 protein [Mucilaginibacter sp.]